MISRHPDRTAAEAAQAVRRRYAERRDRSVKRWASAAAVLCIALAAFALQPQLHPPQVERAMFVVESISGGLDRDAARRVREGLTDVLTKRGAYDADSRRVVRVWVWIVVSPPMTVPEAGGHAQARSVDLFWVVDCGERSNRRRCRGTIRQNNWVAAEMDPIEAIVAHGGLDGAARGMLQIMEP